MRTATKALGVLVILATAFILIPYVALGPGGEYRAQGSNWGGWILAGLLMALVRFGGGSLLLWGAARLGRHRSARPDNASRTGT